MDTRDFHAIVIGSGPNGLAAAITLQQANLSVLLIEAKPTIGGGLRSAALTLSGYVHDVCAAIHPLAVESPFFKQLPLAEHGLKFLYPEVAAAHPFDDGTAVAIQKSITDTAYSLGTDKDAYPKLIAPLVSHWPELGPEILGPLHLPRHPLIMAKFGWNAIQSAQSLVKKFHTKAARGLWAGMAAHAIQPLSNLTTSAIGLVLLTLGHVKGWPVAVGGSQQIANALASYFISLGGKIETNFEVHSLGQLPSAHAVLLDVTPRQLLHIAGQHFSAGYKRQLNNYRYGMGVFKMDWALNGPIPFTAPECRKAGTVHLGATFEEIAHAEQRTSTGQHPDKPFVLVAQQSLVDNSRAPAGKHTAWAYCHVPNGSTVDMTSAIENQIERFAPGFRDLIAGRHVINTAQLEQYNSNYIGGDINGGILDVCQLFTRPSLRLTPYRTSEKGIYICSSSTPPGGGVHGMCGYHAAKTVLHDVFKIKPNIGSPNTSI